MVQRFSSQRSVVFSITASLHEGQSGVTYTGHFVEGGIEFELETTLMSTFLHMSLNSSTAKGPGIAAVVVMTVSCRSTSSTI